MLRIFHAFRRILLGNTLRNNLPPLSSTLIHQFCTQKPPNLRPTDEQLKAQGKEFYENHVEQVIEITTIKEWETLLPTLTEPLWLIICYATWCEKCRITLPKVQNRAKAYGKILKIIKVNIDKGNIASAFKLKETPSIILCFGGQTIDSIGGIPRDEEIDAFFGSMDKIIARQNSSDKAHFEMESVRKLMQEQKYAQAQKVILEMDKDIPSEFIPIRGIFLAQIYMELKKVSKFKDQLKIIEEHKLFYQKVELREYYNFLVKAGEQIVEQANSDPEISGIKAKITKEPSNLAHQFELSEAYHRKEDFQAALEIAIGVVKANRNWQEGKAKAFILKIFKDLGNASPVTQKYRKIYQRTMN